MGCIMSGSVLLALLVIFLGGIAVAVQAPINASLSRGIGDPVLAAAISFGIGFVILSAVSLLRGALPGLAAGPTLPWWVWSGGVFGAFFVWTAVWGVGTVGVLSFVAALIFGQLVGALAVDAIGAFGVTQRPIDLTRIGAVLLVGAGLLLSRF